MRPRANASICCSPPDIVPACWRAAPSIAGTARTSHRARRSRLGLAASVECADGQVLLDSKIRKNHASFWHQRNAEFDPLARRKRIDDVTSPCERALLGFSRPATHRIVVVLPAPLLPIRAVTHPSGTVEIYSMQNNDIAVAGRHRNFHNSAAVIGRPPK